MYPMHNRRLVDVRQPGEFAAGFIQGAELVPLGRLSRTCEAWDRRQPITLICRSGHRAEVARRQLCARGFEDVMILPGGIQRWRAAGKPLEKLPQATGVQRLYRWSFRLGLVLACLALAHLVSLWFLAIPAFFSIRWLTGY